MARMVTITITYDMDDEDKSLSSELHDWVQGHIEINDLDFRPVGEDKTATVSNDGCSIYINEDF